MKIKETAIVVLTQDEYFKLKQADQLRRAIASSLQNCNDPIYTARNTAQQVAHHIQQLLERTYVEPPHP